MPEVEIVIPNWNGVERLKSVLWSLARQSHPIQRTIVVDNGSADDSVATARGLGAFVVELRENTGFSHAVNCGLRETTAEWVAILNNDVALAPDWLERLVAGAEQSNAWFATGKLLDAVSRDRIDGSYDAICRGACAWRCGHGRPDSPCWNERREIRFAPFTAAIFRKELFKKIGALDEQFESYLEDIDFGIRCSIEGLAGVYIPEAVAYHEGSATLGRWHSDTVHKIARNQVLLIAKHYPRGWILRYGWPVFVAQTLWGFAALRHGKLSAFLTGKWEGMRNFRQARGSSSTRLPAVLARSENEIRDLQQLTGFDLYWKLYFSLT